MKKTLFLTIIFAVTFFICNARTDVPSSNKFKDLSAYFQRNLNDLNPVEGLYEVTLCSRIPGASVGSQTKYKMQIMKDDEYHDFLIASFVGYSDPFDKYVIPESDVNRNPVISLPHAKVLLLTTPYHYGFCLLLPGNELTTERFPAMGVLKLDPNTYNFEVVDFGVYSTKVLNYLKIPESSYRLTSTGIDTEITLKGERLSVAPSPAPVSNIGKTLVSLKEEFPDIHFIRNDNSGELYQDGNTEDGISQFFSIINNEVAEEKMVCESTDNFSREFFTSMRNTFLSKYPNSAILNSADNVKFVFPYYTLSISYGREGRNNVTTILYKRL